MKEIMRHILAQFPCQVYIKIMMCQMSLSLRSLNSLCLKSSYCKVGPPPIRHAEAKPKLLLNHEVEAEAEALTFEKHEVEPKP